jgi:hypothetical protein
VTTTAPETLAAVERLVAAVDAMTREERELWATALVEKEPAVAAINRPGLTELWRALRGLAFDRVVDDLRAVRTE